MHKVVVANEAEVIKNLTEELQFHAKDALSKGNRFYVGLSGGSVLKYLCEAIPRIDSDLDKWIFFFCDERYVDINDEESTFGVYQRTLLPKTKLQESQFINIDLTLPLEECAQDYEAKMRKAFELSSAEEVPAFDVLLLGMGPDGHTCSLFPEHKLLQERVRLIAPIDDSPKPPPKRVTMTLTLINNAKCCIFAMSGAGKADMVKRIFVDKEQLPAGLVAPKNGKLIGIFDEAAGKHIF